MEQKTEEERKKEKYEETLGMLDKLIIDSNSSDQISGTMPQLAGYLRQIIEGGDMDKFLSRILSPNVIHGIREALLTSDSIASKSAVYIMVSIVSYLNGNKVARDKLQQDSSSTRRHILGHLNYKDFQSFWSIYFDLLDILNEKQFHLIEPFVIKLKESTFVKSEFLPWLVVLIQKMMRHDNRAIAKEGLMLIIKSGLSLKKEEEEEREMCLKCLQNDVLPVLKENVAWLLPVPEEFFEFAENLGKLFFVVSPQPVLTILDYLIEIKTCMSPLSTYFLVFACKYCITGIEFLTLLTTVNQVLLYRLNYCEKFAKKQIENLFIDIIMETRSSSPSFHCSNYSTDREDLYFHLFIFLGGLDDDIFCKNNKRLCSLLFSFTTDDNQHPEESENFDKWLMDANYSRQHAQIFSKVNQSSVKCKGFFRWLLLHAVCSEKSYTEKFGVEFSEHIEKILSTADMSKLWSVSREEEGIQTTLVDFANNASSVNLVTGTTTPEHLISVLQFLFRFSLQTLYSFLHTNNISESDFLIATSLFDLVDATEQWKEHDLEISKKLSNLLFDSEGIENKNCLPYFLVLKLVLQLQQSGKEGNTLSIKFPKTSDLQLPISDPDLNPGLKNEFRSKLTDLKLWLLLAQVVSSTEGELMTKDSLGDIISISMSLIDSGTHLTVKSITEILQNVLIIGFKMNYEELVIEIANHLDELWKCIRELRQSESFLEVFPAFCNFICQPAFTGKNILSKYAAEIFEVSEGTQGVVYILSRVLTKVDVSLFRDDSRYESFLMELITVNVTAACHGEGVPKCIRMMFKIWDYVTHKQDDLDYNDERISLPYSGNTKSRITALFNIILIHDSLKHDTEERASNYLGIVIDKLLDLNESFTSTRYFHGSHTHRYKQRIVQNLLILQPLLNLHVSSNLMRRLVRSLDNDGPQASIRYLTEWIIINILVKYPQLHTEFFSIVEECLKMRPGFGAIVATITIHAALSMPMNDKTTLSFFDTTLQNVSDFLMSQNFIVRIFGNIALHKIFQDAQRREFSDITTKYQVMYNSAKRAVESAAGNFVKVYNNVLNDFYIKRFSTSHFYYDMILIYMPRIFKMANDEIIHESDMKAICSTFKTTLPFFSPDDIKKLYTDDYADSWYLKSGSADGREHGSEVAAVADSVGNSSATGSILQVKNNPWKYLPISEDILDFPDEVQLKKRSRKDQLVVVASLIECIPNLGGLCRTSEVFGVSKYVVSNLKMLDDPLFKTLSVSAHRWIDILEVPVRELQDFLKLYSSQGYTIVACEQAEAKKLNDFQFPQKTVLLLGNEKMGVPADLMHLVDHCVTIPQVGLVRSLNVHVAGALAIWQYFLNHN